MGQVRLWTRSGFTGDCLSKPGVLTLFEFLVTSGPVIATYTPEWFRSLGPKVEAVWGFSSFGRPAIFIRDGESSDEDCRAILFPVSGWLFRRMRDGIANGQCPLFVFALDCKTLANGVPLHWRRNLTQGQIGKMQ